MHAHEHVLSTDGNNEHHTVKRRISEAVCRTLTLMCCNNCIPALWPRDYSCSGREPVGMLPTAPGSPEQVLAQNTANYRCNTVKTYNERSKCGNQLQCILNKALGQACHSCAGKAPKAKQSYICW